MSTFPQSEAQIVDLCQQMIAGYTDHPGDFPSVTPEMLTELQGALASYNGGKNNQDSAQAQAKIATASKASILTGLVETMKNDLKLSEIDCTSTPEKLNEIGWGKRATPQPTEPPVMPGLLRATAEGPGDIWLSWDKGNNKGSVNWVIERRQQPAGGGDFGIWEVVGSSYNTEIHLLHQPRGIQMEYRVHGVNSAGEGAPSNNLPAVL